MAGHSKWANIKHSKAVQDAKRGKIFTKLIREITVAARTGGEDIHNNPRLRAVVDKAYTSNMSKDTIQRAIKRGTGADEVQNLQEVRYEGYAPGGIAVLVECLTDNKNRTVAEVRHAFAKFDGTLGTEGSVAFLFKKKGLITYPPNSDEEPIMEAALELGADDIITNDDKSIDVLTQPESFTVIREGLIQKNLRPEHSEITLLPQTEVACDAETAQQILALTEMLEDLDDVQAVYTNADYPENVLK